MANIQQLTLQGFYRGISQDDYKTQANQVLFSSGLDLNSNTYSVQTEYGLTPLIETNNNDMYCWFYVEDGGGNRTAVAAGENGEIYKSNGASNNPDYTFSDNRVINNAINMNGFVYFISGSVGSQLKVGKMDESNISISGVIENITTSGDTLPNGTLRSTYPVYNVSDDSLLIGCGGVLVRIDSTDVVTNYDLFPDAIIGIEKVGSQFKIYSSKGQVSFFSLTSPAITEFFQVNDFIRGSINRGRVDFMISGFNSIQTNISLQSGYEAPIIGFKYDSDRLDVSKFRVVMDRPQQLARIGDTIYFVNEDTEGSPAYQSLWSYGNKIRGLGDAFQEVLPVNIAGDSLIRSLYGFQGPGNDTIYMGVNIDGVQQIAKYEKGGTKQQAGYMIFNTIDGGDRTRKKKMIQLVSTVSDCNSTGDNVKISISYDQGTYQDVQTIIDEGKSLKIDMNLQNEQWQDLNIRVDVTGDARFHGIRLVYEIIED